MPSERNYTVSVSRLQWRLPLGLALVLTAGGCVGMAVPLGDLAAQAPATSSTSSAAWLLPQPLPASLDPSDAMAMADALRRELAGGGREAVTEWQNPPTGSHGSLMAMGEAEAEGDATCRVYASTVTSIRGVHRYTSRACRTADGRVTVRAIETGDTHLAAAGI